MPKLRRPTGKHLLGALGKAGFEVIRVRGSHHDVRHAGRATVVPVHAGETIGPGLLNKIPHDCELSRDELNALL